MTALLTTAVGSYPKFDYILDGRSKVARGQMPLKELHRLERQATEDWVRFQEEIGMDILVDGEQYRGDMATYFAENFEGFEIGGAVRSYGNRYYRKPIAVAEVRRPQPVALEWWRFAQSLTDRPVKGMLTGPYTIADWSFNEYYASREEFIMALARLIQEEAADLEKAGASYIQIDEPAISARPDEFEIALRALAIVTEGLKATTITHICYGAFEAIYPRMLDLAVDIIDLEVANSNYDLLDLIRAHPFTKKLSMGVLDVHNHVVESVEEVKGGIRKGLEHLAPENLLIDPDCGLKTRRPEEAKEKLRVMMQAVREIKEEKGL